MNNNTPTTKYDADADVLSWEVSHDAPIAYATEMGNIIVHFTKDNQPVVMEVLEASSFLKEQTSLMKAKESQTVIA